MPQPVVPQSTHKVWVIPLVVVLVLVGGYFAFAKYRTMWPFSPQVAMESPTPTSSPVVSPSLSPSISQSPVSDWTTFNSKYFTLSFQVPAGFDVYDSQNYIAIAKGKYETYEIGSNNAFLTIQRFDQNFTKEKAIADARRLLKNVKESKITIDGSEFLKIEGDDYGRYEGTSAGKIIEIFFEKSILHVESGRSNPAPTFDVLATANKIISTIKFSSTANWKTYTNTQYGFEVKSPYNSNASVANATLSVSFDTPPGETRAIITVKPSSQTLQQWYDSLPNTTGAWREYNGTLYVLDGNTTVAGEPALKLAGETFALSLVAVRHGSYLYIFDGNLIGDLLSTFKFTR